MTSAKGLCVKIVIILLVVFANGMGVIYFAKDRINLPDWLSGMFLVPQQLIELFETEEASSRFTPIETVGNTSETKSTQAQKYTTHSSFKCMDKRPPPPAKTIYTWTDSNGVRHISDKPRRIDGNTSVKVAGNIKPDAISINFLSQNLSYDIRANAVNRVKQAMRIFAAVTPEEAIVPVIADVRSFDSKSAYDLYQKTKAPNLSASSGFYSADSNESVVLISTDSQTIATITHELVHTINRHWYGQMVNWMNEGMAEYAEHPNALNNSDWYSYFENTTPIPLDRLFSGSRDSWEVDKQRYYATSWAFVAFIMSENREFMSRLLLLESKNGCQEVTANDVEKLYGKNVAMIQRDFQRWMVKALK